MNIIQKDLIQEAFLLQLRTLVDSCINPEPDQRPDITHVYSVAREMHSQSHSPSSCSSALSAANVARAEERSVDDSRHSLEQIRLRD